MLTSMCIEVSHTKMSYFSPCLLQMYKCWLFMLAKPDIPSESLRLVKLAMLIPTQSKSSLERLPETGATLV